LQKAHAHVVKELPGKFPRGLFSGTGIATVAGKRYMPVAVTTIRMLRKVSPHIPVEVFVMNQDEYEPHICEEVLPQLNAKCIILEDLYSTEMFSAFDIHGYSLKVLAIITSSFENVLFLDADSIPVNDVEDLFLKEPYTSTGYIVWPDYWQRSAAPNFYDIANIPLQGQDNNKNNNNNISNVIQAHLENSMPYMSSESGQIVVDKSRHYKSLLLAGYYNVFGYNYYYPLLSQGACGEGDKETFLSAAYALNEPVYQVDTGCRTAGWFNEQGQFTGVGILQSNPYDDYLRLADEKLTPRIMFMHMNLPKMNPRELFENAEHSERLLNDDKRVRYYGSPLEQMNTYSGKDVELEIWLECQWEVCEMALNQGLVFKDWNGVDLTQLCTNVSRHVEWLKKTHNT
jgi:alpha 1,2-mannosyltransferase